MNCEKLVPSRELCERMEELKILQSDEPELVYIFDDYPDGDGHRRNEWFVERFEDVEQEGRLIQAPTLPRMLAELMRVLPNKVWISQIDGHWRIDRPNEAIVMQTEKLSLPNAVAKALIALKKEH